MTEDTTTEATTTEDTTSEAFFETMYRQNDDPWSFATSVYEQGRYDATLRALEGFRFRRAFEPGCSIGVLTERLAAKCDRVDALDISPTAVNKARQRCRYLANVTVTQGALPDAVPDRIFDLIVLSEIVYYMDPATVVNLATTLVDRLALGGILLAVHWVGNSPDHRLDGDEVHAILNATPRLSNTLCEPHEGFRLDRWVRT